MMKAKRTREVIEVWLLFQVANRPWFCAWLLGIFRYLPILLCIYSSSIILGCGPVVDRGDNIYMTVFLVDGDAYIKLFMLCMQI